MDGVLCSLCLLLAGSMFGLLSGSQDGDPQWTSTRLYGVAFLVLVFSQNEPISRSQFSRLRFFPPVLCWSGIEPAITKATNWTIVPTADDG
jgi:hypothetical protein